MRYWKKKTNATFGIDENGIGSGRSFPDSRWKRFTIVTAVLKSDRSFIGAFLPDLFSEVYQFFLYLSYSKRDEVTSYKMSMSSTSSNQTCPTKNRLRKSAISCIAVEILVLQFPHLIQDEDGF